MCKKWTFPSSADPEFFHQVFGMRLQFASGLMNGAAAVNFLQKRRVTFQLEFADKAVFEQFCCKLLPSPDDSITCVNERES